MFLAGPPTVAIPVLVAPATMLNRWTRDPRLAERARHRLRITDAGSAPSNPIAVCGFFGIHPAATPRGLGRRGA